MGPLRHTVRIILGSLLVIVGIVGLILPVMPGWIFLIPGLLILGDYFPPIRRLVDWAKQRFAEADAQFRRHQAGKREEKDAAEDGATPDRQETQEDNADEVVARGGVNPQQ